MNLVSNNPRILDSQRRTPAHVLALQIMNDIMRMRFPDFGKADDFDKKVSTSNNLVVWMTLVANSLRVLNHSTCASGSRNG